MTKKNRLNYYRNLLSFLRTAEKLKTVLRHSYTSNSNRQESVAEHSWMSSLIALVLFDDMSIKVDRLKVMKMITIHDLAESLTGDIPAFEKSPRQKQKRFAEEKALKTLLRNLKISTKEEITTLWLEFEKHETVESQLAQAIDKIEVLIQHNNANIKTWGKEDFETNPFYKNDYFNFDLFLRGLKDVVDKSTLRKMKQVS